MEIEDRYGTLVSNYVNKKPNEVQDSWKVFYSSVMPNDVIDTIRNILRSRAIKLTNEVDEIIWTTTKSRNYSVKLGYRIQNI